MWLHMLWYCAYMYTYMCVQCTSYSSFTVASYSGSSQLFNIAREKRGYQVKLMKRVTWWVEAACFNSLQVEPSQVSSTHYITHVISFIRLLIFLVQHWKTGRSLGTRLHVRSLSFIHKIPWERGRESGWGGGNQNTQVFYLDQGVCIILYTIDEILVKASVLTCTKPLLFPCSCWW